MHNLSLVGVCVKRIGKVRTFRRTAIRPAPATVSLPHHDHPLPAPCINEAAKRPNPPLPHCALFSQENLPILVEPNRHQIAEHGHAKERDEQHRVSRIQLGCYRAVARVVGPHISRPSRTIAYTSRSCLRSYEGRGARKSPCSCGQSSFGLKQFVGVRAPSFQVASSSRPISRSTARHTRST